MKNIATTRLIPLHTGKGQSVAEVLGYTTDYVENPDKMDGGEWITTYECDPAITDQEFLFSKRPVRGADWARFCIHG